MLLYYTFLLLRVAVYSFRHVCRTVEMPIKPPLPLPFWWRITFQNGQVNILTHFTQWLISRRGERAVRVSTSGCNTTVWKYAVIAVIAVLNNISPLSMTVGISPHLWVKPFRTATNTFDFWPCQMTRPKNRLWTTINHILVSEHLAKGLLLKICCLANTATSAEMLINVLINE